MCATPVAYGGKPHNSLFQTRLGDEPCHAAQESHDFNRGRCQVTIKYSDEDNSYKADLYDRTTYDDGSFKDRYTGAVYYLTEDMMCDLGTGGGQ